FIVEWAKELERSGLSRSASFLIPKFTRKRQLWFLRINVLGMDLASEDNILNQVYMAIAGEVSIFIMNAEKKGADIKTIIAGAGGALNGELNQLKSDMSGKKVIVPEIVDTSALGSTIIALINAGKFTSITDASNEIFRIKQQYMPTNNQKEFLKKYLSVKFAH
ncbi:MAG: FGGY-family carbohydrate kinase, partial [Nitrososphaeria archaeon]